ncbi:hypothetical protein PT974_11511 [Cladobotryum mycophilum]|uniref:Nucleoside phosphorylase domain-containing protein n=1 Tax=Cladobotryum mycophilum TaxID=491253 RepID=A0ABR0S5E6_9HYPO
MEGTQRCSIQELVIFRSLRSGLNPAQMDVGFRVKNDADFLDCDLRDIFRTTTLELDLSYRDYHSLDQGVWDFLASLNDMVNKDIVYSLKALNRYASELRKDTNHKNSHQDSYDIAEIGNTYPNLKALMFFLDMSDSGTFSLGSDLRSSLFILPSGEAGGQAMRRVAAWKAVLQRLVASADRPQSSHGLSRSQTCLGALRPAEYQSGAPQGRVGFVMDAIFKEFQQVNCGMTHEIKLRVSEELHTGAEQTKLEMLVSCHSGCDWHEVVCDSFRAPVNLERKDNICISIQKTQEQRTKLRLFIDQRGLFDVTDEEQPISTSLHDYKEEALSSLFDKNRFCRISTGAYLNGQVQERFYYREKITLALALARCLMDFFGKEFDLAPCNWNPENIFFMRSARSYRESHWWYILVGSRSPRFEFPDIYDKICPGNPVLLSFAKLLLEILNGEKIPLEIDSQSINKNVGKWGEMCGIAGEVQKDEDSFFLEAVQGCLYLHMHLPRPEDQRTTIPPGIAVKKAIYEHIVQKLEQALNPKDLKRKRQEPFSESPQTKKPFTIGSQGIVYTPLEDSDRRDLKNTLVAPSYHYNTSSSQAPRTLRGGSTGFSGGNVPVGILQNYTTMMATAPPGRDGFSIAIICANTTEYNAVCQIFDEFWDEKDDQYGKATGDYNTYTPGRIGKHNVVLVLLYQIGKANAAAATAGIRSTYGGLELALLVGICGGVPFISGDVENEILLGDVVISTSIIQYDFGKEYLDNSFRTDTVKDNLSKAATNIRSLLQIFETDRGLGLLQRQTSQFLVQLQNKGKGGCRVLAKYSYPGTAKDQLFKSDYLHKHHGLLAHHCSICHGDLDAVCQDSLRATCEELGCEETHLVHRERIQEKQKLERSDNQEAQEPVIHLGAIVSGDTVLKSGKDRDKIARKEGVIAFEMERPSIWEDIPCIIIRGVSDYTDSHANKKWQHFAAATAAATAKALLYRYTKTDETRYGELGKRHMASSGGGHRGSSGTVFNGSITARNIIVGMHASEGAVNNSFG